MDPRDNYIKRIVGGKTFADVGGLWGLTEERASVARFFGASRVTQIDMHPEHHPLWSEYRKRIRSFGYERPHCISRNFLDYAGAPFDVIHTSGVLYHVPDPFAFLCKLKDKTRSHAILTTLVLPTFLDNKEGVFETHESSSVYVPSLTAKARRVLNLYFRGGHMMGIGTPYRGIRNDYAGFWWLPTVKALEGQIESAGFEIQGKKGLWGNRAVTLLLKA